MGGVADGQSTQPMIIFPVSFGIRMEGLKAAKMTADLGGDKFYRHHFGLEVKRELRQDDNEAWTEEDRLAIQQTVSEKLPHGLSATNIVFDDSEMDGSTQYCNIHFDIEPS